MDNITRFLQGARQVKRKDIFGSELLLTHHDFVSLVLMMHSYLKR